MSLLQSTIRYCRLNRIVKCSRVIQRLYNSQPQVNPLATNANCDLFESLLAEQKARKLQKMVVKVRGETKSFLMNKEVSTPLDVAYHMSAVLADSTALCVVHDEEGDAVRSMNEPLRHECEMEFVSYHNRNYADLVNESELQVSSTPFQVLSVPEETAKLFDFSRELADTPMVKLCRFGSLVEVVDSPVISHAGQIGRFSIVKVSS